MIVDLAGVIVVVVVLVVVVVIFVIAADCDCCTPCPLLWLVASCSSPGAPCASSSLSSSLDVGGSCAPSCKVNVLSSVLMRSTLAFSSSCSSCSASSSRSCWSSSSSSSSSFWLPMLSWLWLPMLLLLLGRTCSGWS